MSHEPEISLVVPVYNVAQYIGECLESIRRQDFSDFEVVLVDDGSTDGSAAICDCVAASDSRFRVIHQSNGGSSVARNTGIDASTGRYIAFMDSDDVIHESYISRLYKLAGDSDADIAMFRFAEGELPDMRKLSFAGKTPERITGVDALESTLYQKGLDTSPCCKLFRRHLFDSARFAEGILYEDLDFVTAVTPLAGHVIVSEDVLYFYRHRAGSNIGSFSLRRLDVLSVTESICRRVVPYGVEMQLAARDRRLSAAFNMLVIIARNGYDGSAYSDRCWDIIRELRGGELTNRKVRLKNKCGVLLSYCGRRALSFISRITG